MSLNFLPSDMSELKPRITVIGVGGAGGNAVNNMIQSHLEGVEFIVANTDAQSLAHSRTDRRVQLGTATTQGLGAGSRPDIGRASAEESIDEIMTQLQGSNMVFITAGMGGGTGTGAAPVIARSARESGILTIGVVTKPFDFEGRHRMRTALAGIEELQQFVDTLIISPNQNLFLMANERTTFADAFRMADNVLYSGVRGVTDLMVMPGLINLDFADVRSIMSEMGKAMMGTGEASGEKRAREAAELAISNPLLDDVSMRGARGILINITGGNDITLFEVDEAVNCIKNEVDPDANIIFGSTFDENMEGVIRVSVVATGIESPAASRPTTISLSELPKEAEAPSTAPLAAVPEASPSVAQKAAAPAEMPAIPVQQAAQVQAPEAPAQQPYQPPAPSAEMTAPLSAPVQQQMQAPVQQAPQQQQRHPSSQSMASAPVTAPQDMRAVPPRRSSSLIGRFVQTVRGVSGVSQPQQQQRSSTSEPMLRGPSGQESYPNAPLRQQAVFQQPQQQNPAPAAQDGSQQPPRQAQQPQQQSDVDLDIPAFLRRQQTD